MILRVERVDKEGNISMTFNVKTSPEEGGFISFGAVTYRVKKIIKFAIHTLALVEQVNVLKLTPSQILRKTEKEDE